MTDVEVLEPAEIIPIGQVSIYASTDPRKQLEEASERAAVLMEMVNKQGLSKSFGAGRPHVMVEGWSFLGSQFGLIADIEWTKELDDGWEARAALIRLSDGTTLTHAEAECRRSEANWKSRDSYALRSMAQTRAVSKVFRNTLSPIMVMAGYQATPAEEMDGIRAEVAEPVTSGDPHCPACLAVNGELVAVRKNTKKPYWKCTKDGAECAGAETGKDGKVYSWSGWHEKFGPSAEEWLQKNGYESTLIVEELPPERGADYLKKMTASLIKWTKKQREEAYFAVVTELDLWKEDGSVDLTLEAAHAIFQGMHQSYMIEHPPTETEAPF